MRRRTVLQAGAPLLVAPWSHANTADTLPVQRLATAWRGADQRDRAGILEVDWAQGRIGIAAELALPGRAHGLLPLPDGGFLIVANRPGRWLMRVAADGREIRQWQAPEGGRSFNGHAELGPDGQTVFTTETDPATGAGWVGVRRLDTLELTGHVASHGIDPHQMQRPGDGTLWLANGGIPRDALGRKRAGERMAPSLVRLDMASGRLLGRWTLPDPQLSIRHLALGTGAEPLLGVALQAEHDSAAERAAAPVLAVCDGQQLHLSAQDTQAGGYAGDISAGPGGGFVISAQKQGCALWWHPGDAARLTLVAQVTEPCGLVAWPDGAGTQISAGRGLALWHAREKPRMLAWPVPLAPDNHIVRLAAPA
jgi:hypothetical protein